MSTISISKTASYTTTDGTVFSDRGDAIAHEVYLARKQALEELFARSGLNQPNDDGVRGLVNIDCIALLGDAFLEALTVKKSQGRKKAQQKVATAINAALHLTPGARSVSVSNPGDGATD